MNEFPLKIPNVKECLDLMEQYHMLPNIKEHSIVVTRVAEIITSSLITVGHKLSLDKVIAGALLHDIGKTACLDNEDDHAAKGIEICRAHKLEPIADIVEEHVILRNYSPGNNFAEKEIVYYADKRVNHDQVVSLEERLVYILERYGLDNVVRRQAIKRNYALCQELEKKIFSLLPFEPFNIQELLVERQTTI
jgi:putative nucleotidyltransferase with HDIG domain